MLVTFFCGNSSKQHVSVTSMGWSVKKFQTDINISENSTISIKCPVCNQIFQISISKCKEKIRSVLEKEIIENKLAELNNKLKTKTEYYSEYSKFPLVYLIIFILLLPISALSLYYVSINNIWDFDKGMNYMRWGISILAILTCLGSIGTFFENIKKYKNIKNKYGNVNKDIESIGEIKELKDKINEEKDKIDFDDEIDKLSLDQKWEEGYANFVGYIEDAPHYTKMYETSATTKPLYKFDLKWSKSMEILG